MNKSISQVHGAQLWCRITKNQDISSTTCSLIQLFAHIAYSFPRSLTFELVRKSMIRWLFLLYFVQFWTIVRWSSKTVSVVYCPFGFHMRTPPFTFMFARAQAISSIPSLACKTSLTSTCHCVYHRNVCYFIVVWKCVHM